MSNVALNFTLSARDEGTDRGRSVGDRSARIELFPGDTRGFAVSESDDAKGSR